VAFVSEQDHRIHQPDPLRRSRKKNTEKRKRFTFFCSRCYRCFENIDALTSMLDRVGEKTREVLRHLT